MSRGSAHWCLLCDQFIYCDDEDVSRAAAAHFRGAHEDGPWNTSHFLLLPRALYFINEYGRDALTDIHEEYINNPQMTYTNALNAAGIDDKFGKGPSGGY